MSAQQRHVLHVGAEHHVKDVAGERYRAYSCVEESIPGHTRERPSRDAKLPGLPDEVARYESGDGIADPRDDTDDGIQSNTCASAGN